MYSAVSGGENLEMASGSCQRFVEEALRYMWRGQGDVSGDVIRVVGGETGRETGRDLVETHSHDLFIEQGRVFTTRSQDPFWCLTVGQALKRVGSYPASDFVLV